MCLSHLLWSSQCLHVVHMYMCMSVCLYVCLFVCCKGRGRNTFLTVQLCLKAAQAQFVSITFFLLLLLKNSFLYLNGGLDPSQDLCFLVYIHEQNCEGNVHPFKPYVRWNSCLSDQISPFHSFLPQTILLAPVPRTHS